MSNVPIKLFEKMALQTEEHLETQYQKLVSKVSLFDRLLAPWPFYIVVSMALFIGSMSGLAKLGLGQYLFVPVVTTTLVSLALLFLMTFRHEWLILRDELVPLSKTPDLCARGLEIIELDNDARTWRDTAVAQGRQLRKFDYLMMSEMHQPKLSAALKQQLEEDAKEKHEEARRTCAALHTASSQR